MIPDNNPGARYFAEGQYVAADEAAAGNSENSASYREQSVHPTTLELTDVGSTFEGLPAIYAWQQVDPAVVIRQARVPSEGLLLVASIARDNGNGTWRYEYAIFNINSHRSVQSFTVPIQPGTVITNAGFHDVDYHSGEPYDPTDWSDVRNAADVTWSSPQTHDQNPDSNALRWGTMYNFRFDADAAPADGAVTLGLFKPGTPASVDAVLKVPGGTGGKPCPADLDGSGDVAVDDLLLLIAAWGTAGGDITGDGNTDVDDLLVLLAAWGPCP